MVAGETVVSDSIFEKSKQMKRLIIKVRAV
jgi:hypothetical protein